MRWNEENKEILWNTIFKTQSFHLDLDTISAEWPGEEKPTPKAIKEFLGRYRKSLGGDNKITFGMNAKRAGEDGIPTGKPRKKAATAAWVQTGKSYATPKGKSAAGGSAAKGKNAGPGASAKGTKGKVKKQDDGEAVTVKKEIPEESAIDNEDLDDALGASDSDPFHSPSSTGAVFGTPPRRTVIKREMDVDNVAC
ncbi:hypothetical protein BJX64DRAFT_291515 [Aspergillus heterothallicus]